MTQPQRNEERLLDYLYGELDADARAQVEAELANSPALREELEGHRRVRTTFAELPRAEQSEESAQRMTALLMQHAAQHAAAHKADRPATEGGGKLLAFQPRSLRRIFTNPATGIFAAAAAALFWVVFKTQAPSTSQQATAVLTKQPSEETLPGTTAQTTAARIDTPVPAMAPVEAGSDQVQQKESAPQGREPESKVWAQLSRTAASDTLARGPEPSAEPQKSSEQKPMAPAVAKSKDKGSLDGKVMALKDSAARLAKPYPTKAESAELYYRQPDNAKKVAAPSATPSTVADYAPPPPPVSTPSSVDAAGSVRAGMAQTQARRNQRVIEELANQELGAMPGGGVAATGHSTAAAPPVEPERYAQADTGAERQAAEDEGRGSTRSMAQRSREGNIAANNASNVTPSQTAQVSNVDRSASMPLLAAVQDLLRQGRCSEANAALVRVEQSFPATRGLAEARAQWQRSCASNSGNQPGGDRQMLALPNEQVQTANPLAPPAPVTRDAVRSKRAAPARAKAIPASKATADSAPAY